MFELATPMNKVIVAYQVNHLHLHGCRNMTTLLEEDPLPFSQKYNWNLVPSHDFFSLDDVLAASKKLNAIYAEGFVVRDHKFSRIKIKAPMYVQLSLLSWNDKGGLNSSRLLNVIQMNEGDEFISYFPHYKPEYDQLMQTFNKLVEVIGNYYAKVSHIQDDKEFSKVVQTTIPEDYVGWVFQMKKLGNAKEVLATASQKKILQALKKLENPPK